MAEIKNNFLQSKMNRDIDDRLLQNGQYRYALNMEVNRSEGSDVGTMQNVLGNSPLINYNTLDETGGLECIGAYPDTSSNNIYLFFTNYSGDLYTNDVEARNLICVYNTLDATNKILARGNFLNFSTKWPVLSINVLENLLFWTDNRNQPRKINLEHESDYYTIEAQISVSKLSPVYPILLYKDSIEEGAIGEPETSMYDVTSIYLPDGITDNPYYDASYIGDPNYLKRRFVRFSYRFRFEDGEYSIFAPFTQIAYIPKQDGYFKIDGTIDNEVEAYRSTIVSFMQNKVDNILLQIQLPCAANILNSTFKITTIDILYKESDSLPVQVVDTISCESTDFIANTSEVYEYNYQSRQPFKTLPEKDLIRVSDRVPIKALGQEIASNRVIYSNFQNKATYPKYLDYNVGYGDKYAFGTNPTAVNGTSIVEYPNHTIKQNRNYQVGIILCDLFGRESGVILSNSFASGANAFGASSLYVPYRSEANTTETPTFDWPGYSLKVLFNNPISPPEPDITTGWPGLYNGDINDSKYNPLGWYSYKIVVKQTEQEYYNVYLPGLMAAYPGVGGETTEFGKTAHTVLLNDNINKVPRDLKEVGPAQLQFRSSVVLYGRVNNIEGGNEQYYPGNKNEFVSTIATENALFGITTFPLTGGYTKFYQYESNPLIARITTTEDPLAPIGVTSDKDVTYLAIYETAPVKSRLDIYWETSTVGIISELNLAILNETGGAFSVEDWVFSLDESDPISTVAAANFRFAQIGGIITVIPTNVVMTVLDGNLNPVNKFSLSDNGSGLFSISTTGVFYYGYDASILESYTFNFQVTAGDPITVTNFITKGKLTNIRPSITNCTDVVQNRDKGAINIYTFTGVNGSLAPTTASDLTWSIVLQEKYNTVTGLYDVVDTFTIVPNTGLLQDLSQSANGDYFVTVRITDAGGLICLDDCALHVKYPAAFSYYCIGGTVGCTSQENGDGPYATLAACQQSCQGCYEYSIYCPAYYGQCSYFYKDCTTGITTNGSIAAGNTIEIRTCSYGVGSTGSPIQVTELLRCGNHS